MSDQLLRAVKDTFDRAFKEDSAKRDAREQELQMTIMRECVETLDLIAQAMRYPRISLLDLAEAVTRLQKAVAAAEELDQ